MRGLGWEMEKRERPNFPAEQGREGEAALTELGMLALLLAVWPSKSSGCCPGGTPSMGTDPKRSGYRP